MQMQLALICIRRQLMDAQMADRQRRARHLWQRGRLAAILSGAVPIWIERTTPSPRRWEQFGELRGHTEAANARRRRLKAEHVQSQRR